MPDLSDPERSGLMAVSTGSAKSGHSQPGISQITTTLMRHAAPQLVSALGKGIEQFAYRRVIDWPTRPIGQQVLLADIGDVARFLVFGEQVVKGLIAVRADVTGILPPRDRQLAVLRTGWLHQAPYEWGQHVQWSKAVGITSEEIERVTIGSSAPEWTAQERAVLQAAEELHERSMVCDATWMTLAETLDDRQLFELMALCGQFTTIAYVQNSLRLRLEPGNAGLDAR